MRILPKSQDIQQLSMPQKLPLNANAGTLIIGHFSARYKDIIPLVEEARTIFP